MREGYHRQNKRSHITFPMPLTQREEEAIELLCQGLRNRDIAEKLGIQVDTCKTLLSNAYKHLGVNCAREAIVKRLVR